MSPGPDLLTLARTCLAASTTADEPSIAAFYVGSARIAVTKLRGELHSLEIMIGARESELARRGVPVQLEIEEIAT